MDDRGASYDWCEEREEEGVVENEVEVRKTLEEDGDGAASADCASASIEESFELRA